MYDHFQVTRCNSFKVTKHNSSEIKYTCVFINQSAITISGFFLAKNITFLCNSHCIDINLYIYFEVMKYNYFKVTITFKALCLKYNYSEVKTVTFLHHNVQLLLTYQSCNCFEREKFLVFMLQSRITLQQ